MTFNFCSPRFNGFVPFRYESHSLRTPFTVKYLILFSNRRLERAALWSPQSSSLLVSDVYVYSGPYRTRENNSNTHTWGGITNRQPRYSRPTDCYDLPFRISLFCSLGMRTWHSNARRCCSPTYSPCCRSDVVANTGGTVSSLSGTSSEQSIKLLVCARGQFLGSNSHVQRTYSQLALFRSLQITAF